MEANTDGHLLHRDGRVHFEMSLSLTHFHPYAGPVFFRHGYMSKITASILLKYAEKPALDPSVSGKVSLALREARMATAAIIGST